MWGEGEMWEGEMWEGEMWENRHLQQGVVLP